MNDELRERIISLIPSQGLKNCIKQAGFVPSDAELLSLAFNYAPDFDTRLGLLGELKNELAPVLSEYTGRLIGHQLSVLEDFKKPAPQTAFELHIKTDPDAYDERYLCGSYEAALDIIPLFYKEYECGENELSRYRLVKRKIYGGGEGEDFAEDELGEMDLLPGRVIRSVDIWSRDREAEQCDGSCMECPGPCARRCDILFPCFIRCGDAVRCIEYSGEASYGVALQDGADPCEEYYVIPLDCEYVKLRDFDNMHYAHRHIPAPLAERISADDLPDDLRACYAACLEYLKTDDYYGPKLPAEE